MEHGAVQHRTVVVGVATFQRSDELRRCLAAVGAQVGTPGWEREVLVVDNDPEGSGRLTAQRAEADYHLRVRYVVEPEPGIAAARNRCVEMARGYDYLAFVDDDEIPDPRWLRELTSAAERWGAALTGGPVLSKLPDDAPSWAAASGAFERASRPDGPVTGTIGTGNLLIDLPATSRLTPLFDNRYGLSGGSDRALSIRARRAGLTLAWAPTAVIEEPVPPSRLSIRWVLRRSYRLGNVAARMDRDMAVRHARRSRTRRGSSIMGRSVPRVVLACARRRWPDAVRAARLASQGAGMVAGAVGLEFREYRRGRAGRR